MASERGPRALERFRNLVKRNENALSSYYPPRSLKAAVESMPPNYGEIFIVTCSDSRIVPHEILGLKKGEASIIRNAAGRAVDAIRSLEVMGSIVPIGLIIVMHHTDCGAMFITNETVRTRLSQRAPEHAVKIKDKWFGEYSAGIDASVLEDVENIKAWPFLPSGTPVLGYVFELETGRVREVTTTPTITAPPDTDYLIASKI